MNNLNEKEVAQEVPVQEQPIMCTCGYKNDNDSNFCGKCGVKLNAICPSCWIKKQPYNCGFEKCIGYRVFIKESTLAK